MRVGKVPAARTVALFALLAVVPLLLLTYLSARNAAKEARDRAESELRATADVTAEVVDRELTALESLVESYAARTTLATSVATGDRRTFDRHIRELGAAARGIEAVVLTTEDGIVVGGVGTLSLLGDDLSGRDWFRGVTTTGSTYLSTAFTAPSAGGRPIVASATPVQDERGRTIAYLAAGYEARYLRKLTAEISRIHAASVRITDRVGVVVADADLPVSTIVSQATNPAVRAALRGGSGLVEHEGDRGRELTAFAPVRGFGWGVTVSRPTDVAYAAVGRFRTTVLMLAVPLGLVILAASALLAAAVAARRRAEREANEQAVIARAFVDSSSDAIAIMKPDGDALLTNDSWRAVAARYGMTETSKISDVLESASAVVADPEAHREKVRAFLEDRGTGTFDFDTADGRSWRVLSAPVSPPDAPPLGRIFSLSDRTHERRAEQAKEELVATVSHELRTPLASIVGFAELLAVRDPEAPVRQRYLETISSEAKRLNGLINDFLDIQTLARESGDMVIEAFDVTEIVRRQSELIIGSAERHRLEIDLGGEPIIVAGDPDRIAQVTANLLTNAVKYSPAGGPISVRATHGQRVARISVADEGLGLADEHKEVVFEKFFRADSSDKREVGGTGLGLAVAREIVVAHRGRIGCESRLGEGSTFWFEIPLALADGAALGEQPLDGGEQA